MSWDQSQLIKLKHDALTFDIELDEEQLHQFMKYYELLVEWNRFMNLTAITEFEAVCTKHFIDSISLCKVVDCSKPYHRYWYRSRISGYSIKDCFPKSKDYFAGFSCETR